MTGSDKNNGVGFGRNRAIELASGKYLAIQDADDISLPERLEKEINVKSKTIDLLTQQIIYKESNIVSDLLLFD
jgi:glycosyltransferase involved in cell wall biosynthesis